MFIREGDRRERERETKLQLKFVNYNFVLFFVSPHVDRNLTKTVTHFVRHTASKEISKTSFFSPNIIKLISKFRVSLTMA